MFRSSNFETYKVKEVSYKHTSNTNEYLICNIDNLIVNVRLHLSQYQLLTSGVFEGELLKELYKAESDALMRFVYDWFKYFPQLKDLQDYKDLRLVARESLLYGTNRDWTDKQVRENVADYCTFFMHHFLPMLLQMGPMLRGFPAYVG